MTDKLIIQDTATLDAEPLGVCIALETGEIIHANDAFLRIVSKESVIGSSLNLVLPNVEFNETSKDIEAPCSIKGGFWARLMAKPCLFKGQSAWIFWATDITDIKKLEIEASNTTRQKAAFLATMSHEIRTPMQSVYGLLELIGDEKITKEALEMVGTAKKSASGLLEILDDILDFAKVDAGKMELDQFEVPVRTLCYGAIECMEVKLSRNVKLIAEVTQDVPFVVVGDPTRLRQILINLIGNAMKFTESGTITVAVSKNVQSITVPTAPDTLGLRFEIRDTGIGMKQSTADRLFKAFVQADNSTTRKYGGTGLGLSICQKLIELMNGRIGVNSEEGKGSTFWFEIPTTVASETNAVDLPKLDGLAVLSVEDHPKGAKEILNSLKSMGADVASVPTFAEGLDLIKKRPFDVAVIDQGLPDGLGIDLMKEAVKLRPYMGLIMYTVRDDIGLQHSARVLGAKYLSKPASRVGLGEAVKSAAVKTKTRDMPKNLRLLIAEDTASVQDVLKRQLDKLGVKADFVDDGAKALKVLEKGEHGILFTDLHMPNVDGYQLVARIRADEETRSVDTLKRFPVVVLTADVQMAQRQAYLSYGFDECLLKPVSLGQFRQLLVRWGLLSSEETTVEEHHIDETALSLTHTSKPAVDPTAVINQMGGMNADTIEMLKMFITMTEPLIAQIEQAHKDDARLKLRELGHSLKGSARSACCMALGDAASEVQDISEKGQRINASIIARLRAEFERARAEINAMKV